MPILIEGLPNDIAIMCLARIPFYLHPKLEVVSRSWREAIRSSELLKAREETNSVEELLCVCSYDPENLWELYDPLRDLWITLPLLPSKLEGLAHFGVVFTFRKIFVIGGQGDFPHFSDFVTKEVWCYDPITRIWAVRAPMLVPRAMFACCVLGEKIVVAGGYNNGTKFISKAEIYDPEKDVWVSLPDLNHINDTGRIGDCSGFVIEEKMHVFHRVLPNVQILNGNKLEWENLEYSGFVEGPRAVVGGSVYTMRGGILYKLEREEKKAIVSTSEFTDRTQFEMVGLGDDIYAIGGLIWHLNQNLSIQKVEKLSAVHVLTIGSEKPTWRQVASMTKCSGRMLGCTNLRI